jgi:cell wall-associated NlpC family hydrolase
LLAAPALFIGCSNNKTASLKPPSNETKITKTDTNATVSKKDKLLASAVFGGELSLDTNNSSESNDIVVKSIEKIDESLTKQALGLEQEWIESDKVEELLSTAKKYLGVKYIWAANGPSAFDCSGFTKYVFKKSGIALPRYSGHQANIGQKVKFKDLEKGDLVFFDTAKKFTRTVNHVGIFLGNNKFIHASSARKKVIITCFKEKKFYKNKFLHARRVINNGENIALHTQTKKQSSFN